MIVVILIILIFYNVCINPLTFFDSILNTLNIWLMKVFPSLFTFYIITSALINFKIINKLSFIFFPIKKIFKLNFETSQAFNIFILSMFSGNPSTILFINQNLDSNLITLNDANVLLKCASFISPFFIISFFSFDLKSAYILIFSHFLSNFIYLSFLLKNNKTNKIIVNKTNNNVSSIDGFLSSVRDCINILLMIAAMMCLCNIIKYSLINILEAFHINNNIIKILLSLIELSTGLNDLTTLNLFKLFFLPFASFLLGFGGFCIHLQVKNTLNNKLNFSSYFYSRIIQGIISSIITIIIIAL